MAIGTYFAGVNIAEFTDSANSMTIPVRSERDGTDGLNSATFFAPA